MLCQTQATQIKVLMLFVSLYWPNTVNFRHVNFEGAVYTSALPNS